MTQDTTHLLVLVTGATCALLFAASVMGAMSALTGAWILHCGRTNRSPVPALPRLFRTREGPKEPAEANGRPRIQRLGV